VLNDRNVISIYIYTMLGVAEPDKVLDDIQSERIIILLCKILFN